MDETNSTGRDKNNKFFEKHKRFVLGMKSANNSFEHNQSFPSVGKSRKEKQENLIAKTLTKFTGEELHSYNYSNDMKFDGNSSIDLEKSFSSINSFDHSRPSSRLSLGSSWSFSNLLSNNQQSIDKLNTSQHLNKMGSCRAVLTIDSKSSTILTANKQTCKLFGYTSKSLVNMKISKLFTKPDDGEKFVLVHDINENQGNIIVASGKVMEAVTKDGEKFAVSVWMRKYEGRTDKPRCVVVVEQVNRIVGTFSYDSEGKICSCDNNFALIHGYANPALLKDVEVLALMPSYNLPEAGTKISKNIRKQRLTSLHFDGGSIPLSVYIQSQEFNSENDVVVNASVWYFSNLSGLLTFDKSGKIQNINNNFSLALIGHNVEDLKTMKISDLLPELNTKREIPIRINEEQDHKNLKNNLCKSGKEMNHVPIKTAFNECSFVNIPTPSNDISEQSNSTLSHINSLLLGHFTPESTPEKVKVELNSKSDRENNSWVELTLNEEEHSHSDNLERINMLLTGTPVKEVVDLKEGRGDSLQNLSLDSAVLSSDSLEKNLPDDRADKSPPSSSSDYQSQNGVSPLEGIVSPFELLKLNGDEVFVPDVKVDKTPFVDSKLFDNTTSTPMLSINKTRSRIGFSVEEGIQETNAKHKNGSLIPVKCEIRYIEKCELYCMWLSLCDPTYKSLNGTLNSSFNSTMPSLNASAMSGALNYSLGAAIKQAAQTVNQSLMEPDQGSEDWFALQGRFGEKYNLVRAVGNGAFGFVRLAIKKEDKHKVVVKFIRKEKVLDECWVDDYESDSQIPLEIALLSKFEHSNIVNVLEYFENDKFFTMVMPMHGTNCIDLFEFIDREPQINEELASYMYRQIISAVHYLHIQGVVHRDIKDENIIVDESFCCKLIDFGSAAFYKPGKSFGTFCGTIEYCCPEVLLGNRYEGPELEIWALGVTLYTLVYGENPFHDVEETVEAVLKPPSVLSAPLMDLIQWMLQPVPEHRCKMTDVLQHPWINFKVDVADYRWEDVFPSKTAKNEATVQKTLQSGHMSNSFNSSDENLADQVQYWLNEQENELEIKNGKLPKPDNSDKCFPLTRRLENMNLNHSI